jgi:XTP/dITP diphosphohydrolase
MEIVVSTRNKNKFREISAMLKSSSLTALNLDNFSGIPEVEEDGATFRDNACKKALTVARLTMRLTVADDSGLAVDALDGAPGVYSARFSGKQATYASNNAKLLKLLRDVPRKKRTARFICCVAVADAGGIVAVVEGVYRGIITEEEKGRNGFGYDPVFYSPALKKTFAQLSQAHKNRISHRAKAFKKAKTVLTRYLRAGRAKEKTIA